MGNVCGCAKHNKEDLRNKLIIGSFEKNVDDIEGSTIYDDVYSWASTQTTAARMTTNHKITLL